MTTELLNCDCMEYMATLDDNAFDLAIVDPPYGINVNMNAGRKKNAAAPKRDAKNWDTSAPPQKYFDEVRRCSSDVIVWGANYLCHMLPITKAWIYWDKMQDGFGKAFSTGELAWTTFNKPMQQIRYKWQGNYCGTPENITTKTSSGELSIHPTQKPIALYKWLLKNYAKPGQRVLDTHLGSGSSAIAAHYFGCDFVGCELDKDYFDAASARFKKETRQIDMFGTAKEAPNE